jgi:hypothetical protein
MYDPTVKLGDFLTSGSLAIATITLLTTWAKDRRLRRKEYSDRVRKAAADTAVALERWRQLALHMFDDLQALVVDVDIELVKEGDLIKVRDSFWRGLHTADSDSTKRILNEKIETAYVGLYGYHPEVQSFYDDTVRMMNEAKSRVFRKLVKETQEQILSLKKTGDNFESAQLGNLLRKTIGKWSKYLSQSLSITLDPFRNEMLRMIAMPDKNIMKKWITEISIPEQLPFPTDETVADQEKPTGQQKMDGNTPEINLKGSKICLRCSHPLPSGISSMCLVCQSCE